MHLAARPPSLRTKEGRRTNYARYYPSALALDVVWACWPVLRPVCLSVCLFHPALASQGAGRCLMPAIHLNTTVLLQRTSLFLITRAGQSVACFRGHVDKGGGGGPLVAIKGLEWDHSVATSRLHQATVYTHTHAHERSHCHMASRPFFFSAQK